MGAAQALTAGAVLLALLAGCASPPPPDRAAAADDPYERSIPVAAVRQPHFAAPLRRLPPGAAVEVASFTEWGPPDTPTRRPIWVSLPDQLREFCVASADPVLAIQQTLGLPPQPEPSRPEHRWQVVRFVVARTALFRPCVADTGIEADRCGSDLDPARPPSAEDSAFLLAQLWNSHRARTPGGRGYPFTGMGWSYNWNPQASSPVGVSEYVVRPGTPVRVLGVATPRGFCNGSEG